MYSVAFQAFIAFVGDEKLLKSRIKLIRSGTREPELVRCDA